MSRIWRKRVGVLLLLIVATAGCGGDSLNADAGDDFNVAIGEGPQFDGCSSSGDIATYTWTIRQAPALGADAVDTTLNSSAACSHTVDAMVTNDVGSWTIELLVTDQEGATATDTVDVTVTN